MPINDRPAAGVITGQSSPKTKTFYNYRPGPIAKMRLVKSEALLVLQG